MRTLVHRGEDGWLFQTGGEHRVIDLYRQQSAFTDELATAWVELLRERADKLQGRGIEYVHVTAPDKLTLLNRHYLDTLENPQGSPIRQLHGRYVEQLPNFLNVVHYLENQIDNYPVYWKTDRHWTAWGCFMAYQLLCSRLKIPTNTEILNYPYTESPVVQGLGQAAQVQSHDQPVEAEMVRTYGLNRYSSRCYANQVVRYRENRNLDWVAAQVLASAHSPLSEAQLNLHDALMCAAGSHVVYRNEDAGAVDKTIVLFGDSYSHYQQTLLTGMLAETVREVHFIWSQSIDHEYLRLVRPDIVITQNSEASLLDVPDDGVHWQSQASKALHDLEAAYASAVNDGYATFQSTPLKLRTRRTPLLEKEIYQLDPPVMVQSGCDRAHQELTMKSNPVSLVELDQAQLYFNGERCSLTAANNIRVFDYAMTPEHTARLVYEEFRPLQGTSFLLAPTPGAHCYYHWMLDVLPKLGLLQRHGIALDSIDHFLVRNVTGDFQTETLARLGIDKSRIVETISDQYFRCEHLLHIDMNNGINLKMNRFIPLWLKQTYLRLPEQNSGLKLYISRPEGVRRGILNEDELLPLVREAGFTVVVMEGLSVAEQASLLSRADAVMAPHGGALTNLVFCRPGIPVIEILSRHVYPYYYGLSQMCGHRYHAIMEDPVTDFPRLVNHRIAQAFGDGATQKSTQGESFSVDLNAVKCMLQEIFQTD